jgi:hypothetical protein
VNKENKKMLTDFQAFIDSLHPEQVNFLSSLTEEESLYLKKLAKQTYESLQPNGSVNKIRALAVVENAHIAYATTAEERNINGLRRLFGEYDKFAPLSDAAFGEVVSEELWAHQGLFSRESAMLESIVERLKRSNNGPLNSVMFLEFEAMEKQTVNE